jgi:glycosyltransferase involved in cell wall biosynthesis
MRIIALIAAYNERRYIAQCLEHLIAQGLDVYLIDNGSTDETVAIAERYRGRGLIGIETFPRGETYSWRAIVRRKEALAATLDADWFLHLDVDEIRLAPHPGQTLAQFFADADARNYNAVNFMEFTFVPVREHPDHDHPHYMQTMRHYYPFAPTFPHRLNAWKRQRERVNLAWSGGHVVRFPGLRACPQSGKMRHYLFLSVEHFLSKYQRNYDPHDLQKGWHGWRARIDASRIALPAAATLRTWTTDDALDPSEPRATHVADAWALPVLAATATAGARPAPST